MTTQRSPEEVLERIREKVDTSRRRPGVFGRQPATDKSYYGLVENAAFVIFPHLPVRDGGYRLTIKGALEPVAGGTRIYVSMWARMWLIVIIPLAVAEALILHSRADSPWIIPGFWCGYHLLGCLLVWFQVRRLRRDLRIVLDSDQSSDRELKR